MLSLKIKKHIYIETIVLISPIFLISISCINNFLIKPREIINATYRYSQPILTADFEKNYEIANFQNNELSKAKIVKSFVELEEIFNNFNTNFFKKFKRNSDQAIKETIFQKYDTTFFNDNFLGIVSLFNYWWNVDFSRDQIDNNYLLYRSNYGLEVNVYKADSKIMPSVYIANDLEIFSKQESLNNIYENSFTLFHTISKEKYNLLANKDIKVNVHF